MTRRRARECSRARFFGAPHRRATWTTPAGSSTRRAGSGAALRQAGFAADRIETITAADIEDIETPFDMRGFPRLITLFLLSLGDHVRELERMRRALEAGQAIVAVTVDDNDAKFRAAGALTDAGSERVKYFGTWATETLAGPL